MNEKSFEQLTNAFATSLQRYCDFLAHDPGADAKSFTAHHNAAKAAVTHMLALKKLTKLFETHKTDVENQDLEALLLQARQVLAEDYHETKHQL